MTEPMPENTLRMEVVFEATAEVETHPNCPVCGNEGCETNHMKGDPS